MRQQNTRYPTRTPKVAWRPGERRWARKRLGRGWEFFSYVPAHSTAYVYHMDPRTGEMRYVSHHVEEINAHGVRLVELVRDELRVNDGL